MTSILASDWYAYRQPKQETGMTVEVRELYSSSTGPMVSGSRTLFRANAHRARAERSIWRQIDAADGGRWPRNPRKPKGSRGEKARRCVGSRKILADFKLRHYPKCREPTTPKRDVKGREPYRWWRRLKQLSATKYAISGEFHSRSGGGGWRGTGIPTFFG